MKKSEKLSPENVSKIILTVNKFLFLLYFVCASICSSLCFKRMDTCSSSCLARLDNQTK